MHLQVHSFSTLSTTRLYELLQFRQEVFVVEQQCAYLDADGKDTIAWHMWLEDSVKGTMTAYCRILPAGVSYSGHASIGRVISRSEARGTGAGRRIVEEALAWIRHNWPGVPVKISAQCYLEDFYAGFGFRAIGETYLEDDIPHRAMVLDAI